MSNWTTEHYEHFSDMPHSPTKAREAERKRQEAQARIEATISPLVKEHEAREEAKENKTHPLDAVRNHLDGITPAQRDLWRAEDYKRRRAEHMKATTSTKPSQDEIIAAQDTVDRINAWYESELEREAEAEDGWDWNDED